MQQQQCTRPITILRMASYVQDWGARYSLQTKHLHASSTVPDKVMERACGKIRNWYKNCGGEIPPQKELSYIKEIMCVTNWTRNVLGLCYKWPTATSNCQVRMELYIMKRHSWRLWRGDEAPLIINPRSIEVTEQLHAPDLSPGPVARYSLDMRANTSSRDVKENNFWNRRPTVYSVWQSPHHVTRASTKYSECLRTAYFDRLVYWSNDW